MKLRAKYYACLLSAFLFVSSIAEASLLITPTRVAFGERDRNARVTLLNSSGKGQSYRLELMDQKATEAGSYAPLTEEEKKTFPSASKFIRFSPRQVNLGPGERQTIKLIARRTRDLDDGEYRSHLQFTALPPKDDLENNGQMQIKLNLLLSYSIPVILRKGQMDVAIDIEDLVVVRPTENQKNWQIAVGMNRSGLHSATGRLLAFLVDGNGSQQQVGVLNGLNVFPELSKRNANIIWPNFQTPKAQYLRVIYEGQEEFRNQILAEKVIPINQLRVR